MVNPGNTKAAKRKNGTEAKTEPIKKQLKTEILQEYEILKKKYTALEQKHFSLLEDSKKQIEAISLLEETVQVLQDKVYQKTSASACVQTEDMERLWCIECEFPAEDLYELGEHMYEYHAEDNVDYTSSCHYCGNMFKTKSDLMIHSKKAHPEKTQPCRNYLEGNCDFGDIDCWFSHDVNTQISSKVYKCSLCAKSFKSRTDFMYHRKKEHIEIVPQCKNGEACQFEVSKCWYIHIQSEYEKHKEKNDTKNENEYNQNMQNLINMVEILTKRINDLENKQSK